MIRHLKSTADRIIHQRASTVLAPSGKLAVGLGKLRILNRYCATGRVLS